MSLCKYPPKWQSFIVKAVSAGLHMHMRETCCNCKYISGCEHLSPSVHNGTRVCGIEVLYSFIISSVNVS